MSSSDDDESYGVVIDIGTYSVRAGIAGDDVPSYNVLTTHGLKGDQYQVPRTKTEITDWDTYEDILRDCLEHVKHKPGQPIFVVVGATSTLDEKARLTELLLEKFETPGCYVATESCLPLYASGRSLGICVNIGHSGTVFSCAAGEGYPLPLVAKYTECGGELINKLLKEKYPSLRDYSLEEMHKLKKDEGLYCLEGDVNDLIKPVTEQPGRLNQERYTVPECLFTPSLYNLHCPGLHEMVYNLGMGLDYEIRDDLFNNIVLSGGCSKIPGVHKRLTNSLSRWGIANKVVEGQEEEAVWTGGSIIASLSTFQEQLVFRHEYEDEGRSVLSKKYLI